MKSFVAAIGVLVSTALLAALPAFGEDKETKIPKAVDSLPGWEITWSEGSPSIMLFTEGDESILKVCVGLAIAKKDGKSRNILICGGMKDDKIPTAREVASDKSLTGKVKILTPKEYEAWQEKLGK